MVKGGSCPVLFSDPSTHSCISTLSLAVSPLLIKLFAELSWHRGISRKNTLFFFFFSLFQFPLIFCHLIMLELLIRGHDKASRTVTREGQEEHIALQKGSERGKRRTKGQGAGLQPAVGSG